MKSQLIAIVAAVLLAGCGTTPQSTVQAPGISIHDAAESGNLEAVKQHLAAGTDVSAKNKYGYTALHKAAFNGHNEIVELLIGKGADVNAKRNGGKTPLDDAVVMGRKEISDLLRKHGS